MPEAVPATVNEVELLKTTLTVPVIPDDATVNPLMNPVPVTLNENVFPFLAMAGLPLVGELIVGAGGALTVSVNDCVTGVPPLFAVNVTGNGPDCVGVPERVAVPLPVVNVTPEGSEPDSVITGVGTPVAVTSNGGRATPYGAV